MECKVINQVLLLVLILLEFFGLLIISSPSFDYFFALIIFILAIPSFMVDGTYAKMIRWYFLFFLLSCFYSWIFNGQSLIGVIVHAYDYFAILFFFFLVRTNLSSLDTVKVLEKVALCFCCCYILQWIVFPALLFTGAADDITVNANEYRARMPGSMTSYFLLIYSVNRYLLEKKIVYILYAILAFIPILIMGFRSLTALTIFAIFIMIPFVLRSAKRTILYGIIGVGALFVGLSTGLAQSKIEEMMERQEDDQTFENEDYIRFLSLNYYWNEQFDKPYEKIIGGGVPVDWNSRYYKIIDAEKDQNGFYWDDLGVIGLGLVIGFPAAILLILLYVVCMWKCKEPDIQYVRFTLFVVLVGSIFTTRELYREGNILLLSFFLYLEYKYHAEQSSLPVQ